MGQILTARLNLSNESGCLRVNIATDLSACRKYPRVNPYLLASSTSFGIEDLPAAFHGPVVTEPRDQGASLSGFLGWYRGLPPTRESHVIRHSTSEMSLNSWNTWGVAITTKSLGIGKTLGSCSLTWRRWVGACFSNCWAA